MLLLETAEAWLKVVQREDGTWIVAGPKTTPRRIERARRPAQCPNCNHSPEAEILRGIPACSEKLDEDREAGQVCCLR